MVTYATLNAGRGSVANEFQPPQLFGYSKSVTKYPFNPTKAKALLNSSSCHVPCKVDFWYPTNVSRPYMPDPKRNFEAFAASLAQAGFNVVAHSAPWRPDYVKHVNEGTAGDLNLIGWTGDFGDPDNFLGTFFQTYSPQFGFHNNAIFKILAQAEAEKSLAKRIALYKKANNMIMKYLPAVPYAHSQPALGFDKNVKGYIPSPVDPPSGCVFRTRYPYAVDACATTVPPLREVAPAHVKACLRDDILPIGGATP